MAAFDIRINYVGDNNPVYQEAFDLAASFWRRVIRGPGITVYINASIDHIDGVGKILGRAGPTSYQTVGNRTYPHTGTMEFDSADMQEMVTKGLLNGVIRHEMGHVLGCGVGPEWDAKVQNLLQGNPVFVGFNSQREYAKLTGLRLAPVPLENTGGPGTYGSHLRESVFDNELMTGYVDDHMPASRLSLAIFHDLGYDVDYLRADAYALPSFRFPSVAAEQNTCLCTVQLYDGHKECKEMRKSLSTEAFNGSKRLVIVSRALFDEEDYTALRKAVHDDDKGFIKLMERAGWHQIAEGKKKGFEKRGPGVNATVSNGRLTAITDHNGYFAFTSPRTAAGAPLALSSSSEPTALSIILGEQTHALTLLPSTSHLSIEKSSDGALASQWEQPEVWAYTVEYGMSGGAEGGQGGGGCCKDKGKEVPTPPVLRAMATGAMDGRCLDYNGWWSDGQNYAKSDWRAYRNFVMSDCDRAFFQAGCWQDEVQGSCWAVHGYGGCSRVIGHPHNYHQHIYPN